MAYSKLIVVLPCHGLEDFPVHITGSQAESLLACWTALWHPSLIAAAGKIPSWESIDFPTQQYEDALVVIPTVIGDRFNELLAEDDVQGQPSVVSGVTTRDEILIHPHVRSAISNFSDADSAADFFSLSYCVLQIQLMTRQLRYSSTLDMDELSRRATAAATAAIVGNRDTAKSGIQTCFDLLLEEKTKYYPVRPQLLDLVLLASTTLGKSLDSQLATTSAGHKQNFLLTGELIKQLQSSNLLAYELLRTKVSDTDAHLVGGLETEIRSPLMSAASVIGQLKSGRQQFESHFTSQPTTFVRRTHGLNAHLPGILRSFGFDGVQHVAMDEGTVPTGSSPSILWQGSDSTEIGALTSAPINAAQATGFLGLGVELGRELDSAHYSNMVFAHYPNHTCDYFNDLVRSLDFGGPLGAFIDFQTYLESTYDPGYSETYSSDEYRDEYLKQDLTSKRENPISRTVKYWQLHLKIRATKNLVAMLTLWKQLDSTAAREFQQQLAQLQLQTDRLPQESSLELAHECCTNLINITANLIQQAGLLPESIIERSDIQTAIISTLGFANRFNITEQLDLPPQKSKPPILFADSKEKKSSAIIEVPAFGCVRIANSDSNSDGLKNEPSMIDGLSLSNEYFKLLVDQHTGGIRSVNRHRGRKNLLTQQLAYRVAKKVDVSGYEMARGQYGGMVADDVQAKALTRIEACVTSSGRLVAPDSTSDAETLAEFQQRITVRRGSPLIQFNVQLKLLRPLQPLAWQEYISSRIAWPNESAEIFRSDNETRQRLIEDRFTAPSYVQVADDDGSVTLLPQGLPFHKRSHRRMLDTLLQVAGENEAEFQFSIAIDQPLAIRSATACLTPYFLAGVTPENKAVNSWLFHLSCKNVMALDVEIRFDERESICGATLLLQETEGQGGRLKISAPFELKSAESTDFNRQLEKELAVDGKTAIYSFNSFQIFQIELHW